MRIIGGYPKTKNNARKWLVTFLVSSTQRKCTQKCEKSFDFFIYSHKRLRKALKKYTCMMKFSIRFGFNTLQLFFSHLNVNIETAPLKRIRKTYLNIKNAMKVRKTQLNKIKIHYQSKSFLKKKSKENVAGAQKRVHQFQKRKITTIGVCRHRNLLFSCPSNRP